MGSKKKERVPLCQEKKKIPLWKRLVLAELHADADFEYRSRCQTKLCHASCWKLGFLFFMQVPASIKKTLAIASNRNLKSCLSIRCLTPQHILRFFLFLPRLSPLPLAALLIVVSFSSTFHWAIANKKIKLVWNELLFPGNLDVLSLTLGGQFCSCCGIRYPINSLDEPFVVSRIIGFWHFLKRKVA